MTKRFTMEFLKKVIFFLIFFKAFDATFAQDTDYFYKLPNQTKDTTIEFFKNYVLDVDLQPQGKKTISETQAKEGDFYFAQVKKNGLIVSVGVYDANRQNRNYLLDREFNLYFAYMKITYNTHPEMTKMIKKMDLYNAYDEKVAYINYRWIKKPKGNYLLREAELFKYVRRVKDFRRVQDRFFIYKNGHAFGDKEINNITMMNGLRKRYSNANYGGNEFIATYIRYNEEGEVQYKRSYVYSGGKLSETRNYNPDGVLKSVTNGKKSVTANGDPSIKIDNQ
jgi:hypothetical protein